MFLGRVSRHTCHCLALGASPHSSETELEAGTNSHIDGGLVPLTWLQLRPFQEPPSPTVPNSVVVLVSQLEVWRAASVLGRTATPSPSICFC